MPLRNVSMADIKYCLRVGEVSPDVEWDDEYADWKYKVEGADTDYDALVLPGGTGNADHLRMEEDAVSFVREFADKPIAVICHGAWILTDADLVRGKKMTSYPSLKTDLKNAGATWVDEEVVVDRELLDTLSDRQLRVLAREIGLRTRRRNSGKRRTRGKLIDLLLKNADRLQVD